MPGRMEQDEQCCRRGSGFRPLTLTMMRTRRANMDVPGIRGQDYGTVGGRNAGGGTGTY
ncbi:hypothetical protein GSVR_37060 [Geobacter sp. SVR]|nr:hypothetical protein GSVR_37060 [Geobacter sp. SVR]